MPGAIEGRVVAVSESGNLITDITSQQLADVPRNESVCITCDGHQTFGIFPVDHQEPEATLLALIGSSGNLEIEIVGMSVSEMLGIGVGQQVSVQW